MEELVQGHTASRRARIQTMLRPVLPHGNRSQQLPCALRQPVPPPYKQTSPGYSKPLAMAELRESRKCSLPRTESFLGWDVATSPLYGWSWS